MRPKLDGHCLKRTERFRTNARRVCLAVDKRGFSWRQELALMRDVVFDIRMLLRQALRWKVLSDSPGTAASSLKGATISSSRQPTLEHSHRSSHDETTWARFQLAQWRASSGRCGTKRGFNLTTNFCWCSRAMLVNAALPSASCRIFLRIRSLQPS